MRGWLLLFASAALLLIAWLTAQCPLVFSRDQLPSAPTLDIGRIHASLTNSPSSLSPCCWLRSPPCPPTICKIRKSNPNIVVILADDYGYPRQAAL
jgi:hypothetical protein